MNTNSIPEIVNVVQSAGFNLSATQVGLILSAGAAIIRWMRFEIALGVKTWGDMGGLAGIKQWLAHGNAPIPQKEIIFKHPDGTSAEVKQSELSPIK